MTAATSAPPRSAALEQAYDACRAIAKREARNFYYAFLVLPRHKSDAMCAIYAFMRQADDLADDESMTLDQRRAAMRDWTQALHRARLESTADPVLLAVNDTQQRFGISDALLDQLVQGTTLDLEQHPEGVADFAVDAGSGTQRQVRVYETFEALYRYCYLVASVVGLVCIRIFGYTDARAEMLAEKTGIAFQLTNILRDVREDAERGRVYLPLDHMAACAASVEQLQAACAGSPPSGPALDLLQCEITLARDCYAASDELIPLLDADAREAMRVMAGIYRQLLERIAADPAAVFRGRVSVPTHRKLALLGGGMLRSFVARGRA